ncbi:uncharacterized protein LOC134238352 isoform X2 [Saccostrea cucullata]|uniref:uncharacterized protein LOC134238352 isoform X2 n=1 Tax=Saccostrea cuccullata TaxID=36930 RepID=UPI002ED57926
MSSDYKYAVVEFPEEEEVEVVPIVWLTSKDTKCRWPPYRSSDKTKLAIKGAIEPTSDFLTLPVRVLKKYSDYLEARKHLTKATYTSDLQTDAEEDNASVAKKRSKRPNPRFLSSDESEEEPEMPNIRRRQSPRKKRDATNVPPLPALPPPPSPQRQEPRQSVDCQRATVSGRIHATSSTSSGSFPSVELNSTFFDKVPYPTTTTALDKKILECIEEVKVQTHHNTKLLQAIMKKLDGLSVADDATEEGANEININFPLTTKDMLLELEDNLQNENTVRKLVKSLSTIGGENVKNSVRRLLGHMISNELAKTINWVGKGGKIAFSTLKLNNVLKATIRKNRLCATSTDSEIAVIAKDWFRFAGDRDGGRKKREEIRKAKVAEEGREQSAVAEPASDTEL